MTNTENFEHKIPKQEFEEERRRITHTQWRLSRKWDELMAESVLSFEHDLNAYAAPIRSALREQLASVKRGTEELMVARFTRDVERDEHARLRAVFAEMRVRDGLDTRGFRAPTDAEKNRGGVADQEEARNRAGEIEGADASPYDDAPRSRFGRERGVSKGPQREQWVSDFEGRDEWTVLRDGR